jgi:Na+-transporting NADH:ubiquinone oxidoreductase subunit NqrB
MSTLLITSILLELTLPPISSIWRCKSATTGCRLDSYYR